jgi:VWFA-related protein
VEDSAPEAAPPAEALPPGPARLEAVVRPPAEAVFRATSRVVEVYATITDSRGRYVDDLKPEEFTILEGGQTKPVFAFENHTASVSVALLFDTTGSMENALPSLKSAALHFLDELRPEDSVAVYSFNSRVTPLQSYTTDKVAAQRAVLRAHASGTTALYDALLRVNHDMAGRAGKKVILVFTDGDDNASMLTSGAAILRAKARGIPIYTIAEGEALDHPELISQLSNISHSTGGTSFLIRKLSDISAVFQKISDDLMHGYLLAFQPADGDDNAWHKIEVVLANGKGRQIRAREGYYPD